MYFIILELRGLESESENESENANERFGLAFLMSRIKTIG